MLIFFKTKPKQYHLSFELKCHIDIATTQLVNTRHLFHYFLLFTFSKTILDIDVNVKLHYALK